ncbi:MAG: hypothetical protein Q9220_003971 [cf. Caloplaca sp. 1 TL-2023]
MLYARFCCLLTPLLTLFPFTCLAIVPIPKAPVVAGDAAAGESAGSAVGSGTRAGEDGCCSAGETSGNRGGEGANGAIAPQYGTSGGYAGGTHADGEDLGEVFQQVLDIIKDSIPTASTTAAPTSVLPTTAVTNINARACLRANDIYSGCAAQTSGFDGLAYRSQASCLCYWTSSGLVGWQPQTYDNLMGSCYNYLNTQSSQPTAASNVKDQSSLCTSLGDGLMAPAHFDLGQMELDFLPSNLRLTSRTQLSINLPDNTNNYKSIQEIVSAGIWISRGNGLNITTRIQTDSTAPLNLDKDIAEDGLAELLSTARLWTQLSLKASRISYQAAQHLLSQSIDIALALTYLDTPNNNDKKDEKIFNPAANIHDIQPPAGVLVGFLDSIKIHLTFWPSKAPYKSLPTALSPIHRYGNARRSPRLARNTSQGVKYVYDTETSSEDGSPDEEGLIGPPVTCGEPSLGEEMLDDTEDYSGILQRGPQQGILTKNGNAVPDQILPNDMKIFERCERDRKMLFGSESSFSEEELLFDHEPIGVGGTAENERIPFHDEMIDSDDMDEDLFASYENTPNPSQETVVGWVRRDEEEDMMLDIEERGERENEPLFDEQQRSVGQDQETAFRDRRDDHGFYTQGSLVVNTARGELEDSRYIDEDMELASSPMLFDDECMV